MIEDDRGTVSTVEAGEAAATGIDDEPAPATITAEPSTDFPPGDYAIVEFMGHQTLIGRVAEVTRFGAAMLQIEPIFAGALLPPVLQGGSAIYRFTSCTAAIAFARAPKATQRYALPDVLRAVMPQALLPAASADLVIDRAKFLGGGDDDFDSDTEEDFE